MASRRPRYPDALIFDATYWQGYSFEPVGDDPRSFQTTVDEMEARDPVVKALCGSQFMSEGFFGPWD